MFTIPSAAGLHMNNNADFDEFYSDGQKGAWYDPSDLSTMFQNYAGTVPVTAVGQPVSLILDKSQGMVVGSERATGSMGTVPTDWTNVSGTTNIAVVSNVLSFELTAGGTTRSVRSQFNTNLMTGIAQNFWYKVSIEIKLATGSPASGKNFLFYFYNATVVFMGETDTKAATNDWQTLTGYVTSNRADGYLLIYANIVNGTIGDVVEVKNFSIKQVSGNHARQFTLASAPLLQQDANLNYYLDFDGTNDFLLSPYGRLNTAAPLPIGVNMCAGVTKDSDAAQGIVAEWNTNVDTTTASFALSAPAGASATYGFQTRGSGSAVGTTASATAPITNVVTALGNISSPYNRLRLNGVQEASDTTTQGTGNYATLGPLYIGSRGGTSLFFNGRIYQFVMKTGAPNMEQVVTVERYVNSKTDAY
jgi:hypothetical protein